MKSNLRQLAEYLITLFAVCAIGAAIGSATCGCGWSPDDPCQGTESRNGW